MHSDNDLIKKIKNKDIQAFEILYERYSNQLYNFIYSILRNKEKSEDTLQEVFYKIFKYANTFNCKKSSVRTWLYLITRRETELTIKNEIKERNKLNNYSKLKKDIISKKRFDANDNIIFKYAIDSLPAEHRTVLLLIKKYNFKYKEISKLLGISEATIKRRLTAAINSISNILDY